MKRKIYADQLSLLSIPYFKQAIRAVNGPIK